MRRSAKYFNHHIKKERNLSPCTVTSYGRDIDLFITFVEQHYQRGLLPGQVTADMIQAFLEFLANVGYVKRNQPITRVRRLTTLRSWYKYMLQEGLVREDPTVRVRCPKAGHREPTFLSLEECRKIIVAAGRHRSSFLSIRNQAIVATFLMTGLRLAELISLNIRDISLRRRTLIVMRKGQEEQTIPISEELAGILKPYMKARRRRTECRALFISHNNTRIGRTAVWHLVRHSVRKARIRRKVSPHTLRHSFASALLAQGENLQAIRSLLNHKSIATTSRYLHLCDKELVQAVNRLHFSGEPKNDDRRF